MDTGGAMGPSWAFEHDQHGISGGLLPIPVPVYIIDLFIDLKFTGTGYEYRYRYKGFEVCFIRADLI